MRGFRRRYPAGIKRERYGLEFDRMQGWAKKGHCILAELGYTGPGHEGCWHGVQGGWTAHHLGTMDDDGLIYCCGRGHDLLAGYDGEQRIKAFRTWLEAKLEVQNWQRGLWILAAMCKDRVQTEATWTDMDW